MLYLAADFVQREAVIAALRELQEKGLQPSDIDVFSAEPLELPRGVLDRPSRMSFAVVTGAVAAFVLIVSFVYFTQHNYPLVTGGMPIFSFWATGVVFYEMTMFGAILTTFFWFLRESGLLGSLMVRGRRRRASSSSNRPSSSSSHSKTPDTEPGVMVIRVACPEDMADGTLGLLEGCGGKNVRALG